MNILQSIHNLDINLLFFLNNLAGRFIFLDSIVVFFADTVAYLLLIAFLIWLYKKENKLTTAGVVLFSAFVGSLMVYVIRFFYHRPRPFLALRGVQQLLTENSYSFPSNHATFFFALSFAIYLYDKKWGVWFLIFALLIGIARVMAGVHYPSDIIGGALLGITLAHLTFSVSKLFAKIYK